MEETISKVLESIDHDLLSFSDIQGDKKINIGCFDRKISLSIKDYIFLYYQVFTDNSLAELGFDIFSLLQNIIDKKSPKETHPLLRFELSDYYPYIIFSPRDRYYTRKYNIKPQRFKKGEQIDKDMHYDDSETKVIQYEDEEYIDIFMNDLSNLFKNRFDSMKGELKHILIPISINFKGEGAHQNGLIIEHSKESITLAFFDPEGASRILDNVILFGKTLKSYLEKVFNRQVFIMANSDVSRSLGIQAKLGTSFCVMFTYMWFYLFYISCFKINKPMKVWLNLVESSLSSHILNKQDPVKYILMFSYMTIERIIQYTTNNEKYVRKDSLMYREGEKKILERLAESGDEIDYDKIISGLRGEINFTTLVQLTLCNNIELYGNKEVIEDSPQPCEDKHDCNIENSECINKRCAYLPVYENIYTLRDIEGHRLNEEEYNYILDKYFDKWFTPYDSVDVENRIITLRTTPHTGRSVVYREKDIRPVKLVLLRVNYYDVDGSKSVYYDRK